MLFFPADLMKFIHVKLENEELIKGKIMKFYLPNKRIHLRMLIITRKNEVLKGVGV